MNVAVNLALHGSHLDDFITYLKQEHEHISNPHLSTVLDKVVAQVEEHCAAERCLSNGRLDEILEDVFEDFRFNHSGNSYTDISQPEETRYHLRWEGKRNELVHDMVSERLKPKEHPRINTSGEEMGHSR